MTRLAARLATMQGRRLAGERSPPALLACNIRKEIEIAREN